jgi:hypothetical protein
MLDVSIVLVIGFVLILAVLIRIGITLADISNSLERLEKNGLSATARSRAAAAPGKALDESEVALAIAIAKAVSDGSLIAKDSAAKA